MDQRRFIPYTSAQRPLQSPKELDRELTDGEQRLIRRWREGKANTGHHAPRTDLTKAQKDQLDLSAATRWKYRQPLSVRGVWADSESEDDASAAASAASPVPLRESMGSNPDTLNKRQSRQRNALREAMRVAIDSFPKEEESQRLVHKLLEKRFAEDFARRTRRPDLEVFTWSATGNRLCSKMVSPLVLTYIVLSEHAIELAKDNPREFEIFAQTLFLALQFEQLRRSEESVTPSVRAHLLDYDFHMEEASFSLNPAYSAQPRHFISVVPKHNSQHSGKLTLAQFHALFNIGDAFYTAQERGEIKVGDEIQEPLPAIICQYSMLNTRNQTNTFLCNAIRGTRGNGIKQTRPTLTGHGCLWEFYFTQTGSDPAPLWMWLQMPEPDYSTEVAVAAHLAKFVSGGNEGWRRYKACRAIVKTTMGVI